MMFALRALAASALLVAASPCLATPTPASRDAAPPELTEQAIDAADFDGWRTRADAREALDADRKAAEEAVRNAKRKAERKAAREKLASLPKPDKDPDPFLIRAQILLDRAHASPGAIDGQDGDNLKKAVRAFRQLRGLPPGDHIDPELWGALGADAGKVTKVYEITKDDVDGRYVEKVPKDYAKMAKMKWIGFKDAPEMLGERFHMDEGLLKRLNPAVDFKSAGAKILVTETGAPPEGKVTRIVVDKGEAEIRAYDEAGVVLLAAPATIGSPDTPSPEGKMTVTGAFPNPHYIYDPKKNFQQGKNRRKLTLKPGPNGPVGSMWIDLSKPTYGIHGTPEPSLISKTASHGCVRLTNWDAETLGRMIVPKKTTVEFE